MPRALRTFLSCLVMLAIPLQGFASASMVFCGPHHASLAQGADAGHHHDHGTDAAHHHHDATPGDAEDGGLADFLKLFAVKCSACASCCSLAAVPIAPIPALSFLPSIGVAVPFFGSSYAAIVPDGLERPPSQHLA